MIRSLKLNDSLFFCFLMAIMQSPLYGQRKMSYIWPLDSPFVLTANYGELRPNHFHAGLDFSTGGQINLPVYAAEEGYLSRIRVSATGYGKSAYITHPDGKVTVYAHLNSFSLKLGKVVANEQIAQQLNEIDYLPPPRTVFVRRNEIIGLSGNSGGSTGPHLHFELRDELSDVPINPLKVYKVPDRSAPEITHIAIYNLVDTLAPKLIQTYKVKKDAKDNAYISEDELILEQAIIGFAFSGYDRTDLNGNPNGIYSAEIFLNERLIYAHTMGAVPFSEGRYVNEYTENKGKIKFQKCFLPTVYPVQLYSKVFDKGRILLPDTGFQKLKCIFKDESGNSRSLAFKIKTKKFNFYKTPSPKAGKQIICSENTIVCDNNLCLYVPAKTFYNSVSVRFENLLEKSKRIRLYPEELNFNSAANLGFSIPDGLKSHAIKLILKNSSATSTAQVRNDSVFFALKSFGEYQLIIDTVPPTVKMRSSSERNSSNGLRFLTFSAVDALSGIGKYSIFLNGIWSIAEYDAKSDLITCYIADKVSLEEIDVKLMVEDKVGNVAVLNQLINK